jgi:hypothetical protein
MRGFESRQGHDKLFIFKTILNHIVIYTSNATVS